MKTISVSVSDEDYEKFREVADFSDRSIAQLIREAMAYYRAFVLEPKPKLTVLPVLTGHRSLGPLPHREELYDEMFGTEPRS